MVREKIKSLGTLKDMNQAQRLISALGDVIVSVDYENLVIETLNAEYKFEEQNFHSEALNQDYMRIVLR